VWPLLQAVDYLTLDQDSWLLPRISTRKRRRIVQSTCPGVPGPLLDPKRWLASHITFMALTRMKATTIALDPEVDRLLTRAARERGVSRSDFIRQHLSLVLEQYRRHPKPRSGGTIGSLSERGDERELFGARR
jgi:hypothetical protein